MADHPTREDLRRFLDGRCSDDETREIEEHARTCGACGVLLGEERDEDQRLEADVYRLWSEIPSAAGDAAVPPPVEGPDVPRYQILDRIGEGGMGVVYEAEQRGTRRRVALKLLKASALTPSGLARFEREARVLGRLDHPGVATILEADTLDVAGERRPYLAMELVRGAPLTTYAIREGLSTRARVELLAAICDAVQHAHESGVLHRDLKPANVLVTEGGHPKVLDFGIARAVDSDLATAQTVEGQILGTLAYMSPEQVSGRGAAVDERSDVYALGIMLFELLAERLPYALGELPFPAAVRVVAEEDPAPLRLVRPGTPADLETIAGKALEKDAGRRYSSAGALADDLRCFLRDEPIAARPPSRAYLARKLVRRHRALAFGLGLTFLALAAGLTTTTWQAREARAAERGARQEALTVDAVNDFLVDLLGGDNPGGRPLDYTVVQAIEDAERRVEAGELAREPKVEAAVRIVLGNFHGMQRHYARAGEHLERAVELRVSAYGPEHWKVAAARNSLAVQRIRTGAYDEAEALLHEALLGYENAREGEHTRRVATSLYNLAGVLMYRDGPARWDETLALLREATELHVATGEPEHAADDLAQIANLMMDQSRVADARAELERAMALHETIPPGMARAGLLDRMAEVEVAAGRPEVAAERLVEAVALYERHAGRFHTLTLRTRNDLGNALVQQRLFAEADEAFGWVLAVPAGEEIPADVRAIARNGLGWSALRDDRLEVAEGHFRAVVETGRGTRAASTATAGLGRISCAEFEFDEAMALFEAAGVQDDAAHHEPETRAWYGRALGAVGRFEEADRVLAASTHELELLGREGSDAWRLALEFRIELLEVEERAAEVAELRARLDFAPEPLR